MIFKDICTHTCKSSGSRDFGASWACFRKHTTPSVAYNMRHYVMHVCAPVCIHTQVCIGRLPTFDRAIHFLHPPPRGGATYYVPARLNANTLMNLTKIHRQSAEKILDEEQLDQQLDPFRACSGQEKAGPWNRGRQTWSQRVCIHRVPLRSAWKERGEWRGERSKKT